MKFSVQVSLGAIQDIQEAVNYYDSKRSGLGLKFGKEIDKNFILLQHTNHFQIRYDDIRCLPVKNFPYMIHSRIDENNNLVLVEGVICCFMDPEEYWLKMDI